MYEKNSLKPSDIKHTENHIFITGEHNPTTSDVKKIKENESDISSEIDRKLKLVKNIQIQIKKESEELRKQSTKSDAEF